MCNESVRVYAIIVPTHKVITKKKDKSDTIHVDAHKRAHQQTNDEQTHADRCVSHRKNSL